VEYGDPVLDRKTLCDERPVAGLGIAFDTQKCGRRLGRQVGHERRQVDPVQNLPEVALPVFGGELESRALADADSCVLAVLELPKLGGRRQLPMVPVLDPRLGEDRLQPRGVGPGVLAAADAAALADVEHQADVRAPKCLEEGRRA